jgi:UDP-glucose 4-epimerase
MSSFNFSERNHQATIIGGHGFIGKELRKHLEELGWKVWVPDRNDPQLFEKELGKVFYCAGLTADYLRRPFDTVNAHVNFLSQVLYLAKWDKLVYLSSTRIYDGLSGLVDETNSLNLHPENPRHLYDLSKLMGESLCLQTKRASVARLSCVFKDEEDEDGFLPKLLRQVIRSKLDKITVDSSPYFSRDYVHVKDVVLALIAIVEGETSEIFNVATGENILNSTIFSFLEEATSMKIEPTQDTHSLPCPEISIDKMQEIFGWKPQKILAVLKNILQAKADKL